MWILFEFSSRNAQRSSAEGRIERNGIHQNTWPVTNASQSCRCTMGQPVSGRVANLWRSARLSLVILSIFRLVAPVRATELDGVAARHMESSIGAVGFTHEWNEYSTGFMNANPEHNDCTAWDSKGTYDFNDQAGMTLSWCVPELLRLF